MIYYVTYCSSVYQLLHALVHQITHKAAHDTRLYTLTLFLHVTMLVEAHNLHKLLTVVHGPGGSFLQQTVSCEA